MSIGQAILSIRPGAQFVLDGETYEGLDWKDETQSKPSKQEFDAAIVSYAASRAALAYQEKRKEAYPSIAEQLDTLFHGGIDAWKTEIQAVKDQFPKP